MKLFLDTNVLVDYYTQRQPFGADAARLRIGEYFNDFELWASVQSFTDIEYILQKAIPLADLRSIMHASLEFLHVATCSPDDLKDALISGWPDTENFLIEAAAKRVKADFLITRDTRGFVNSRIPVRTPEQFLKLLKQEHDIEYTEIDF